MQPYKAWLIQDLIEKIEEYSRFLFIREIMIGTVHSVKNCLKI